MIDDTSQPLPEGIPETADDAPATASAKPRRGSRKPRRTAAKAQAAPSAPGSAGSSDSPDAALQLAITESNERHSPAVAPEAQAPALVDSQVPAVPDSQAPALSESRPPAVTGNKELALREPAGTPETSDSLSDAPSDAQAGTPAKKRRRRGGRGRKRPSQDASAQAGDQSSPEQISQPSPPPPSHDPAIAAEPASEPQPDAKPEKAAKDAPAKAGTSRTARARSTRAAKSATRPPHQGQEAESGASPTPEAGEGDPVTPAPQAAQAEQAVVPPHLTGNLAGHHATIPLAADTPALLLNAGASVLAPVPVMGEPETQRSGRSRRRGRGRHAQTAAHPESQTPPQISPQSSPQTQAAKPQPADKAEPKPVVKGRKLLVSVLPEEQVEVIILESGKVREYYIEMTNQVKIRGNIYKGVISNIDTNLQAAFVNYGAVKNGFLQIDEVHPEYYLNPVTTTKGHKYPPIQKVLKAGQEVLVQVGKEPTGNKGAFLTTWISLAGRFLVLTPGQDQIGISRKVEDGEERNRLRELIKGLEPGEGLGAIVRTVSAGVTKTTMQKDLNFLKRLWRDIRKKGVQEKAPALVYQEPGLAARAVRDYLTDDVTEVWVDDEATATDMRDMVSLLFPRKADMVKLHTDTRRTLLEKFDALSQIEQIHSREVNLPSGGRLVFDQTEALMAVDINSGKSSGNKNGFEGMAFRTNLEAAEVIPQQLRLRDIGGQIVIDFIEMRDQHQVREVEKTLRAAMKIDRARHDIGNMSSFGLLQIVRQRTGSSAISISMEACPFCQGTGTRRNMEWQAVQALRDLRRKMRDAHDSGQTGLVYTVEGELAWYLLNHKRDHLCTLEKDLGVSLEIRPGRAV